MPLREVALFALASIGGVAIATWAWRRGHQYGTRDAEKDGQILFSRGVAHGAMEMAKRPNQGELK